MKTALITATFLTLSLGPLAAAPAHRVETRQLYTCASSNLSRVALKAEPTSCCEGMLGCPQLLANTGLVKPKRDTRT
jgi:hypothetical protein